MQIIDGNNSKYTVRVAGEERLEVWIPPTGYIRPNWHNSPIRYFTSIDREEKENILPDYLFKIEE